MTTPLTREELHEAGKRRELHGVTEWFWQRVVATTEALGDARKEIERRKTVVDAKNEMLEGLRASNAGYAERHEENRAENVRLAAELHKALAELAEGKRVRAALLATRTFWPLHLREAVERGDAEACMKEAIRAEGVVRQWHEDSVALRDLMRMAINRATGLRYSYRCIESETLIDTVLADYKTGAR